MLYNSEQNQDISLLFYINIQGSCVEEYLHAEQYQSTNDYTQFEEVHKYL